MASRTPLENFLQRTKRITMSKHPGFKAIAKRIAAKKGVPYERAAAILATATRRASVKAKLKNPRLRRVK